jgi:P4 family phage/plasmid primase-like protien
MIFRDGKQEDYIMFCTPFDFDPERRHDAYEAWPQVDLFLRQILPEDDVREYVMKYLASCLSGTNEAQKFHIWTGTGANGKSMLMNLMEEAMGDYATKANIAMFTMGRTQASGANPEVVKMRGKRFVTMSEPDEDYALNVAKIKEYTSGEKILCRDLFAGAREMMEFVLRCKFNLGCNDLPKINSTDNGTWRRIVQLRFNSEFRVNPKPGQYPLDESIQQKVRSVAWSQAFLSYLVHIYITNNGCKNLSPPERIIAYTSEYREDSDAIARFFRDCLRPVQEGEVVVPVRKEMLQETFRTWRVQTEQLRIKMDELMKRVDTVYGRYPKGSKHVPGGWRNFQIVEQD